MMQKPRHLIWIGRTLRVGPIFALWAIVVLLFFGTLRQPAITQSGRLEETTSHLLGLRHAIREEGAILRMQQVFPEGGCFMVTLYALSWANLLGHLDPDPELRDMAFREIRWALDQFHLPEVVSRFSDTQVPKGVFWLGQRNLVLGQSIAVVPKYLRSRSLETEFHENSAVLFDAFMASDTSHLDSYPGLCWPADNVTALASLVLHDRLFGTEYRRAYLKWKSWTQSNSAESSGLPAGHLDSASGEILQPPRGCTNSWILALLPAIDPEYSSQLYRQYFDMFQVSRVGFRVFREYPVGSDLVSDIDSGPIVLGAGVTATGVGLAASLANGDLRAAQDIHGLAATLGLRHAVRTSQGMGFRYLFGRLPVGDAFLTWAYSLPRSPIQIAPASLARLMFDRKIAVAILGVTATLLIVAVRRG